MSSAACWCCGEPAPIRGEDDPWEGRLDGYCVSCATTRCDTTDSTCAVKSAATPEGDTIRTALQGAMVGEWGRENALAALALLEKQNAQLRARLAEYDKYVGEFTRHA